jgi:hypothetical protein
MKIPYHATTVLPSEVLARFTQITRLMNGMAAILLALLFQGIGEVRGQTSQGSYAVKLAWNASSSTDVTGYRIHYGTASGTYTASIVVGNVTSGTVPGLAEGVTYHFAVSAFNAAGLASGYSNDVSIKPGLLTTRMSTSATGESILAVQGLIGRQYDIEASEDLITWILIETVTIPEGGSLQFSDPDAGSYSKRFYRTSQRP